MVDRVKDECSGIITESALFRYVPSGGDLDAGMIDQAYRALLAICDGKIVMFTQTRGSLTARMRNKGTVSTHPFPYLPDCQRV